ncbi:MAG: hypothetical protein KatS3mg104_1747 [Phycisphaerae bacterium]|nr:MAG: hypothetical protein KatS3mg104_1747 [Phycisphaerae bacterium]
MISGFSNSNAKYWPGNWLGFTVLPTPYAAVAAMTLIIAGAFAMQRYRDQPNEPLFPVLIGVPVLACVAVVWLTQSRTALVGLAGCLLLFGMCWWKRDLLTPTIQTVFWNRADRCCSWSGCRVVYRSEYRGIIARLTEFPMELLGSQLETIFGQQATGCRMGKFRERISGVSFAGCD